MWHHTSKICISCWNSFFFLLRVTSSDQFGVKVWKQAIVCCDTPSKKKSRINRLLSFLKRQTQDRTLHSWRGAQDTQCSNKPPATVQTALIPSHCTLMILACCSFSRIAISWVTLPRSGSSTQQSSSTLSFQMNFTTTYTDNSIQHHLPKHGFECQLSEFPGNLLVPHITRGMEVTQCE